MRTREVTTGMERKRHFIDSFIHSTNINHREPETVLDLGTKLIKEDVARLAVRWDTSACLVEAESNQR